MVEFTRLCVTDIAARVAAGQLSAVDVAREALERVAAYEAVQPAVWIERVAPAELDPDTAPLAFPGDIPVEADLLAGPVTDLNVMTRRRRVRASLERLLIVAPVELAVSQTTIILARTPDVCLFHRERRIRLDRDDAALFDGDERASIRLESDQPATLFVIRLTRA